MKPIIVTKNPNRPFVVNVKEMDVRAVGTAFSIRLEDSSFEVLVTEGRVRVEQPEPVDMGSEDTKVGEVPMDEVQEDLIAGQKTVSPTVVSQKKFEVIEPSIQEITRQLSWRDEILKFSSTPLSEVVEAFNRRNFVKMVIIDKELNQLKVNAAVNPSNDNFLELLQASADVQLEWTGSGKILIRK